MSGVEVIGLLAGASQLALYALNISTSISEIYCRVQSAPKRIREHIVQIKQLTATARLIEKHESLQTENIYAHITSTLDQAKLLSDTLDYVKREYGSGTYLERYWKRLRGAGEKKILTNFERLEKEKSALLLSISLVHTDLLEDIKGCLNYSIDSFAGSMTSPDKDQQRQVARKLVVRLVQGTIGHAAMLYINIRFLIVSTVLTLLSPVSLHHQMARI